MQNSVTASTSHNENAPADLIRRLPSEHLGAARDVPGDANHKAVGVRGGHRDLPELEAEAALELRADEASFRGGSIVVKPFCSCSVIACTPAVGECPVIAPVSPRQKSTYLCPSTSQKVPP